jgi:Predicted phosphatases
MESESHGQECTIGATAPLVATFRDMPDALLFDLDGTLIDSIELIMRSMRHAFDGHPTASPTDAEWRALIGRPLRDSFREFVTEEAEVDHLFGRYREYQLEHHDRLVRPYDGVVAAIQGFAARGHPMALVTSKADWLALRAPSTSGSTPPFPSWWAATAARGTSRIPSRWSGPWPSYGRRRKMPSSSATHRTTSSPDGRPASGPLVSRGVPAAGASWPVPGPTW